MSASHAKAQAKKDFKCIIARKDKNMAEKNVFDELSAINVNEHTEKKSNGSVQLTYLSWTWAFAEVSKRYPDMSYEVRHWDGKPYLYDENLGYMIETSVTVNGQTKTMWLPVMDGTNRAMKDHPYEVQTKYKTVTVQPASMMDINKTIMRCLVKNFAVFGLGLYIFAGEDLPEGEEPKKTEPVLKITLEDAKAWWDQVKPTSKKQWLDHYKIEEPQDADIYKFYCKAIEQRGSKA